MRWWCWRVKVDMVEVPCDAMMMMTSEGRHGRSAVWCDDDVDEWRSTWQKCRVMWWWCWRVKVDMVEVPPTVWRALCFLSYNELIPTCLSFGPSLHWERSLPCVCGTTTSDQVLAGSSVLPSVCLSVCLSVPLSLKGKGTHTRIYRE